MRFMTSLSSSSNNYERNQFTDRFVDSCNFALEREVSAYRFVDGVIAGSRNSRRLKKSRTPWQGLVGQFKSTCAGH